MARRFGRRKRPRVAWMPTFGLAPEPELAVDPAPGINVEITIQSLANPGESVVWDAFPLTFDETEDSETAQADPAKRTLRDIVQGNEWRLRRIVGKAFVLAANDTALGSDTGSIVEAALGFIVVKTYDDGTPTTDFNECNPLSQDSMEDPWIWRRVWMLNPYGNNRDISTSGGTSITPWAWNFPQTNVWYGSVADGPHIDAKTARVIHRQERLFGVLAARRAYFGVDPTFEQEHTVRMHLDYRLLGSLRGSAYGNRGNTSR